MTDKATLEALLKRAVALTGPDREMDLDIFDALSFMIEDHGDLRRPAGWWQPTGSIDAALALVERCLPEPRCAWNLITAPGDEGWEFGARLYPSDNSDFIKESKHSLPLAILAALLTALIAQASETETAHSMEEQA